MSGSCCFPFLFKTSTSKIIKKLYGKILTNPVLKSITEQQEEKLIQLGFDISQNEFYPFKVPVSLVLEWIRTERKICVWVEHGLQGNHDITVSGMGCLRGNYKTHYQAESAGLDIVLDYLLKIKNKNKP